MGVRVDQRHRLPASKTVGADLCVRAFLIPVPKACKGDPVGRPYRQPRLRPRIVGADLRVRPLSLHPAPHPPLCQRGVRGDFPVAQAFQPAQLGQGGNGDQPRRVRPAHHLFPLQTRLKKNGGCPPPTILPYNPSPLADQRPKLPARETPRRGLISGTAFPPLKP